MGADYRTGLSGFPVSGFGFVRFVCFGRGVFDMRRLAFSGGPITATLLGWNPRVGAHEGADTLGTDIINKRLEGDIQLQSWPVA